jgi:hypothetical protein
MLQVVKTESGWYAVIKDKATVFYFRYNQDSSNFSVEDNGEVEHEVDESYLASRIFSLIKTLDLKLPLD